MKAMILAAGKGTRVRPLTYDLPKPMIPLLGKPVMAYLVEHLKKHGVTEIMVNVSWLHEKIEEYFGEGEQFGVQIGYSFEGYTTDDGTIIVETDAAAEIPAGESFTEVAATATTAGLAGNLAVGVLTTIPSPLVDDPLATVTNPSRFTGGSPAETDAQLRDRVRRYFTTLRRGTPAALKAGALTVPGVLFATVDESDAHPADGGVVRVYIGDPDARASSVLVSKVANELEDWRAAGIRLEVLAASREEVDLVVAVYIRRGADQTEVRAAVISALDDLIGNLPVGDTLVLEQVASAAIRAHRDVRYARVTTPTSDIVPSAAGNAIRVPSTRREVGFYEVA